MSSRHHAKSRIKVCNPVFHLQDKKADEGVLSKALINSAKRTGQLSLCNRGLGSGKPGFLDDEVPCNDFLIAHFNVK